MYPAFYIAYFLMAIGFALYAAFRTPRAHGSVAMPGILLTLILPSVGFGWWDYLCRKAENPTKVEQSGYYILTKMAGVHGLYPVVLAGCTFYLECFYYEYFNFDRVIEILGVSFFLLIILGIPILGAYALVTMVVPALIGNNMKKPPPVITEHTKDIINAPEWDRNAPAAKADDVSYRVDDEYIPLDDDEDDDFIIDLKN